jgi:hypothetical protein
VFVAVQFMAWGTLLLLPQVWHVESVLLAEPDLSMRTLANPGLDPPGKGDGPAWGAGPLVLNHANLLAIIDETELLRRWDRDRGPLRRAIDAVQLSLRGPVSEKDRRDQLEEFLRRQIHVTAGARGTVTIGIEWPGGETAYLLVEAAQQKFLEARRVREVQPIVDVIAILERHAAETVDAVKTAYAELSRLDGLASRRNVSSLPEVARQPRAYQDPRAEAERQAVRSARARLDEMEQATRLKREEMQARLVTLRTIYSSRHPSVLETEAAITALDFIPPEAATLRARLVELDAGGDAAPTLTETLDPMAVDDGAPARRMAGGRRESMRRTGKGVETRAGESRREGLEPEDARPVAGSAEGRMLEDARRNQARTRRADDPELTLARERLDMALASHERLLRRIETAQVELDVARTAFGYRYTIVVPAEPPRTPARPRPLPLILGGLLSGLALAVYSAVGLAGASTPLGLTARARGSRTASVLATAAGLGIVTVATLALSPNAALAFVPWAAAIVIWAVCRAPIRYSMATVLFLMLFLEAPGDSGNKWRSPWYVLGHLLNSNLNITIPIQALRFAGIDVVALCLAALIVWRRSTGDRVDTRGAYAAPRPLLLSLLVSLLAMIGLIALGIARGGDFGQVLWQCHVSLMTLVMTLLFLATVRGPQDFATIGTAVLAAALLKAIQAVYVRTTLGLDVESLPTATSHADSMLFATAFCMILALLMEAPTRRNLVRALLGIPVLSVGMVVNNRRLVWVEVIAVLLVVYLLAPPSRAKRFVQRALILASPILLMYVTVGWSSRSPIFAPVAKIRSVLDSGSDRSTLERDVENYNLIRNLQDFPVLGMGFGREYVQYVRGDDISQIFPQWRFIPHNSVLGLLAFGGVVGFTALWIFLSVGIFLAGRAYRVARDPVWRAAALTSIGVIVIFLLQCYGDMALVSWHSVFLLGPALAVAGKLATATGAWPMPRARRAPVGVLRAAGTGGGPE